jgi:acyl dehydratase
MSIESSPSLLRGLSFEEITIGQTESRIYQISGEVYGNFLAAFRDESPIHVDEAYAKRLGFPGCVMHGAILNGFISHFVGTWFPGRFSLLLGVDLGYVAPSHLGDLIELEVVVTQKVDSMDVVVMNVVLKNLSQASVAARGRVKVMIKQAP